MLGRPTAKNLSADEWQTLTESAASQTGKTQVLKSYDPNYPVFEVPVNQKVLVYVPNHVVQSPDGSVGLRMDKFAAHPVLDGRYHASIRCTNGIVMPPLGLDGTCPLCDAMSKQWDLYNKEYEGVARAKGISVDAPEAKDLLEADRKKLLDAMTINNPDIWYTFPIVVIECQEKDGVMTVNPKLDKDGRVVGKPYWYSIKEKSFDKWKAAFDSIDVDDEDGVSTYNPAGMWAVLNFTYTSEDGKHNKRDSARNLKVSFKTMKDEYRQWAQYFDEMTKDWTPQLAQQVVVLDAVRDMAETQAACDALMKPINDRLAMLELGSGNNGQQALPQANASADNALAQFGATPVGGQAGQAGQMPPQGSQPAGQTPPTGGILGEMPNVGVQ